ncbi:MAG: hypothetical protein AAFR91_05115 [Pseudomonadota bacterium]
MDNKHLSVRSNDERFQPTGEMQLYARILDGEPQKLRVLSPQCPIERVADLKDLGRVKTSMSVDWLGEQLTVNDSLTSDAIIAISAHEASAAAPMLIDVITDRSLPHNASRLRTAGNAGSSYPRDSRRSRHQNRGHRSH